MMKVHISALCRQGPIRSNNEDAIYYQSDELHNLSWVIIADGMGGHNAGEVASNMLVDHIKHAWNNISPKKLPNWQEWIITELNKANLAILQSAKEHPEQNGMGTTGVLMIIDNQTCHIGWVGDSRAYSFKDNILLQETSDHTMLQELVNKGAISAETAKNANTKNLLSQAIGVRDEISVDTLKLTINNNDKIMLSTDGVHDYLTEQEIKQYLLSCSENNDTCEAMVSQAINNNSRDNLTVGIISFT